MYGLHVCMDRPFGEARGELGEEGGSRLVRGAAVPVRAARARPARSRLTYLYTHYNTFSQSILIL